MLAAARGAHGEMAAERTGATVRDGIERADVPLRHGRAVPSQVVPSVPDDDVGEAEHRSARLQVDKTTIYRRWPGKALVTAAVEWMRRFVHDVLLPDTGSLERDLVEAFRRKVSFNDRVEGQAWAQ